MLSSITIIVINATDKRMNITKNILFNLISRPFPIFITLYLVTLLMKLYNNLQKIARLQLFCNYFDLAFDLTFG